MKTEAEAGMVKPEAKKGQGLLEGKNKADSPVETPEEINLAETPEFGISNFPVGDDTFPLLSAPQLWIICCGRAKTLIYPSRNESGVHIHRGKNQCSSERGSSWQGESIKAIKCGGKCHP